MRRGLLVLFTLGLIGGGVYGAYHFHRLKKAEALVDRAVIEMKDGRFEEARRTLTDAIEQCDHAMVAGPALYLLADSCMREGKFQNAVPFLKAVLADRRISLTDPWNVQSVIALSRLHRRGRYPLSAGQKDVLEETLERISAVLECRDAGERSELKREIDAFGERIRALSFSPLIGEPSREELKQETRIELGFLYLRDNKYDRAEEIFSSMSAPVSRLGLAKVHIERGDVKKGIEILEGLLDHDRTGAVRALYLREATEYGESLFGEKKYDEALRIFEIVGRQADALPYADLSLYYVALYWYGAKRYDRSLRAIESILGNGVTFKDEDALLLKGFVYYDARDFPRALKTFNAFIEKYPGSDQVRKAREWKAMSERSIRYFG